MRQRPKNRPQKHKPHALELAYERGVFGVRRSLATESYDTWREITGAIRPVIGVSLRIFEPETAGVSVVGFSRFDKRHRGQGPKTKDVYNRIPSNFDSVEVQLGALGIFGSTGTPKLSIVLKSQELSDEIKNYERIFESLNFPLSRDHNTEPGQEYLPHFTIGTIFGDHSYHIGSPESLSRLEEIASLGELSTRTLVLNPASMEGLKV